MSVDIVSPDLDRLERDLARAKHELPSAARNVLNDTARAVQKGFRETLSDKFAVTKKPFIDRQVFFGEGDKATKERLQSRLSIQGPGGKESHLAKFEDQGTKTGLKGRLAIPVRDIRIPGKGGHVPRALALKNFMPLVTVGGAFTTLKRRKGKLVGGKTINLGNRAIGARNTFTLRLKSGDEALAQRSRSQPFRLLWVFRKVTPIPRSLEFVKDANALAAAALPKITDDAITHALRRSGFA